MPISLPKPVVIENQLLKLLLYADAGIGKTTLAATAAQHEDMSPVLVLNLEGGLLSIAGMEDVAEVPIASSADLDEVFIALQKKHDGFGHYKTIVLDSGTVLANRALVEWAQLNQQRAMQKRRGDPSRTIDDIQLEDYGKTRAQIYRLISWFATLPYHFVCTALAKTVMPPTDENNRNKILQPLEIRPDFTNQLGNQVMGIFDHVWYMYTDEKQERYMLTQPTGIYRAKTRGRHFGPALGNPAKNPNLADIYDLLLDTEGKGFIDEPDDEQESELPIQTP